ncbi:MAG: iron-containing alcohol dehydrogenase [Christensenellales bacterium]|jgi:alcohol dehydrogenase YqhD (iron-dependent ADH family)
MMDFSFYIPTRFEFGRGAEMKAGEMVRSLGGTHALIHYGGGSAVKSGLIGRVTKSLEDAGIKVETLGGAQPNPRDDLVYEGIRLARETGVDFIVAVGGGSAIDSAKAISNGALYDGDFWDFFCGKAVPQAALPVGVVLTLAAAGSESSNSCVIMQKDTLTKRGLNAEINRPRFALMNPELTYTLPPYQTACGATDIMAHIMERYFTNTPDVDVTDRLCEALLLTVIRAARKAIEHPHDYDARSQLMWAGTLAHNNTCGVGREGDWASHQIEHELSGLYDVAHGAGLAVVFPAWLRYQLKHRDATRLAQFAVRVWGCEMNFEHPEETALQGIRAYEAFLKEIGMPITMKELGAKTEDIPRLAANVRRGPDGKVGFYTKLDTADIEEILHIADR